jgi:hypothetical protein
MLAWGWIAAGASAQEAVTQVPPAQPQTSGPPAAATAAPASGLVACIDPETGELIDPSEHPECRQDLGTAQQRTVAADELQEEPVETGGFMVDLKDRFMKPFYATVKEDGAVDFGHDGPSSNFDE